MVTFQGFGMEKIKVGPIGEIAIVKVPGGIYHGGMEESTNVDVEEIQKIPEWVKNIFTWFSQDQISEDDIVRFEDTYGRV